MTITTNPSRDEYTSTAGQTVFNYTFKIYANTDLNVYVTPSGQSPDDSADLTTDYVVDTGTIGDEAGGFITFNTPLNNGDAVTIVSAIPYDRTVDYQNNGDFLPETVNDDNDRQVSQIKQILEQTGRTLQFQESLQGASTLSLPDPAAANFMRWKSDLTGLENVELVDGALVVGNGQLLIFSTVAAMIASTSDLLVPGVNVQTQGYHAAGDGGDGLYLVTAPQSVDGFGDHLATNGNALILQVSGAINIKQYGAVSDGVIDSRDALNAAFNSTKSNTIGGSGSYRVLTSLALPSGKNFISESFIDILSDGNFQVEGSQTIENINFDMNNTSSQFFGEGANDVMVKNVTATNSTNNGIFFRDGPVNLTIDGCTANGNGKIGIYVSGTEANSPNRVQILNCKAFSNLEDGIIVAGVGELTVGPQTANYANNVIISNCIANGNGNAGAKNGIGAPYCQFVTISSNVCFDNQEHGIALQETKDYAIVGNICYQNGEGGFSTQSGFDPFVSSERGMITGNSFYNNRAGMFFKEVCEDTVVTGNACFDNDEYSVRLVDIAGSGLKSDNIHFVNNSFIPTDASSFVNSNNSTSITSTSAYNSYGQVLQPNQMSTLDVSSALTFDTRGPDFTYPEFLFTTDSGTDISRTLIAQAQKGRRITIMADGGGAVAIRHNQGDAVTYAGFKLSTAATTTLGAFESVTFVGNGIDWIETARNV